MNKRQIAERVLGLEGSPTVAVMDKVRRLTASGTPVVNMSGGDPDFDTPQHIVEAAVKALKDGFTHYTPSRGIPELLHAIATKTTEEIGANYDPKKEILVMPGAKQALFTATQAVIDPGDEAILFDPCWVSYAPCVQLAGGTPVYVTVNNQTKAVDLKVRLKKAITPRTKLIILNTPNNPSGFVWPIEYLEIVADFAKANNLLVLSDEIYSKLIFDEVPHISIANLPGMWEHTLVMNGLSKSHAMTGWRLGWIMGPEKIISQMLKIHQHSVTCATSFVQKAAVAALQGSEKFTDDMVSRYRARRDILVNGLNEIPGVRCDLPMGTFYAFPNISGVGGLTDLEFVERLLELENVAVTPGRAFGPSGFEHVRLSYANSDEMVVEAVERIKRFVSRI